LHLWLLSSMLESELKPSSSTSLARFCCVLPPFGDDACDNADASVCAAAGASDAAAVVTC